MPPPDGETPDAETGAGDASTSDGLLPIPHDANPACSGAAVPTGCALGYDFSCGTSCYYLCTSPLGQETAAEACQAVGGQLASMNTIPEDECTRGEMLARETSFAWIGLAQAPGGGVLDGGWSWSSPASYYGGWAPGQPDDVDDYEDGDEECGLQAIDGWRDWDCDTLQPYICER